MKPLHAEFTSFGEPRHEGGRFCFRFTASDLEGEPGNRQDGILQDPVLMRPGQKPQRIEPGEAEFEAFAARFADAGPEGMEAEEPDPDLALAEYLRTRHGLARGQTAILDPCGPGRYSIVRDLQEPGSSPRWAPPEEQPPPPPTAGDQFSLFP